MPGGTFAVTPFSWKERTTVPKTSQAELLSLRERIRIQGDLGFRLSHGKPQNHAQVVIPSCVILRFYPTKASAIAREPLRGPVANFAR